MSTALPQGFIEMTEGLGHEAFSRLPQAIADGNSPVSVRLNRAKGADAATLFGDGTQPVAWCEDGVYLSERPRFTFHPALHQGLYYVQDASSMAQQAAVARAVGLLGDSADNRPMRYLDACAAPGGKTTAAMAALPSDAFVVANEFDPRRTSVLTENLAKWGQSAVVTRGDASALSGLDGFFDIIAADVPCSGEGMMRKDPQAVAQWTPGLVADCAALQRRIVANLWDALAPGGVFIYSTCTFNLDEDERNVQFIIDELGAEPIDIPALSHPDIVGALGGHSFPAYRFIPGTARGEGLFMAMLRKPADAQCRTPRIKPQKLKPWKSDFNPLSGNWTYVELPDGSVRAMPTDHLPLAAAVQAATRVVEWGLEAGQTKGRVFIPSQSLAMSTDLRRDIWPECDVDTDTAIAYLRREAVSLPDGTPRGIVLLTHNQKPLGFVKNLGNRANNLYPAAWRILSQAK